MIIQPERGTKGKRNADVGMACWVGGKHCGKCDFRYTQSHGSGRKATETAAPSVGQKPPAGRKGSF